MHHPISYGRLVDMAQFRVSDVEWRIGIVSVGFSPQFLMELEEIILQAKLELLHIGLAALALAKFAPRAQ